MDGLELHERLDSLFVAADRLAGNPDDHAGARDTVAATEALRPRRCCLFGWRPGSGAS